MPLDLAGSTLVGAGQNANAFVFDGSSGWVEQQVLNALPQAVSSVAVAGNVLVLGSWMNADKGANAGAVQAYNWDGSNWVDTGRVYADDAAAGDCPVSCCCSIQSEPTRVKV